jgi:hypothetical protein
MWRSCTKAVPALSALLFAACSEAAPPGSGAERFDPVVHEFFAAAVRADTVGLRRLAANVETYDRILLLANQYPALLADASRGVTPQKAPLRVDPDTSYVVYMPRGRYLARNLLAVRFVKVGNLWLIDYVGFQEPRDRY